ncbi:MAG: DUF1638 domain-containing protein [Anaerolineae bacterium]
MRLTALTCEALARTLYALAAETDHTVSIQLFKQGLHNHPRNLRGVLQAQIDAVPAKDTDAILLVYGMCGGATVGLTARETPIVIPRAHDCITLYLGSRARYQEEFEEHPGTYWYSVDYMERQDSANRIALGAAGIADLEDQYEAYVAKFGQEMADMLIEEMRRWQQHYTRAAFIDTGLGDRDRFAQMAKDQAEREGWLYERKEGNQRLLRMLVRGEWPDEDFLTVPPGYTIQQTLLDGLVKAVPSPAP